MTQFPDPVRSLEPPIPLATCGRCSATSDKTDDWYECVDCGRMVCYPCQGGPAHGPNPYDADLCTDCAAAREPQEGEAGEAFRHERDEAVKAAEESTKFADCKEALAVFLRLAEGLASDMLCPEDRRAIEDAIRRLRVTDRPWRDKEGAKA